MKNEIWNSNSWVFLFKYTILSKGKKYFIPLKNQKQLCDATQELRLKKKKLPSNLNVCVCGYMCVCVVSFACAKNTESYQRPWIHVCGCVCEVRGKGVVGNVDCPVCQILKKHTHTRAARTNNTSAAFSVFKSFHQSWSCIQHSGEPLGAHDGRVVGCVWQGRVLELRCQIKSNVWSHRSHPFDTPPPKVNSINSFSTSQF